MESSFRFSLSTHVFELLMDNDKTRFFLFGYIMITVDYDSGLAYATYKQVIVL